MENKKWILSLLTFIVLVASLSSCSKNATFIKPAKSSVTIPKEGGIINIAISSDGNWTATNSDDWIETITKDSTIIIASTPNTNTASRKGYVTILSGNLSKKIIIIQFGRCTKLIPTQKSIEFENDGGTKIVDIDTDGGNIMVNCPKEFKASYSNGKLTIIATPQNSNEKSGIITLSCDEYSATINVHQRGRICSLCKGKGIITCPDCNGKGIKPVYTNGEYMDYCCERCGGYNLPVASSVVFQALENGEDPSGTGQIKCPQCNGAGH